MNIGLAGWSLVRRFRAKELVLLDYPATTVEEFGLSVIELNAPFFASTDADYLAELRSRIDAAGARVANIAVDGQGDLSAADETERKQAVANHARWFDVARAVGSPNIRAFTGGPHEGELTDAVMQACIRSFGELAALGREKHVRIVVENHGGVVARDPDNLVRLMQSDDTGYLGMCPDFGNFPAEVRYEGLEKTASWARVVHAKFHEFDDAGEDTRLDAKRCLDIVRAAGFDGDALIEFEGRTLDDHTGVMKSIALVRKYL